MVAASSTLDSASNWTRVTSGKTPYDVYTKPINKSPQDDREYRLIRLENGLQAMLVHHAKADKSAASLDVAVGHLYDPVSDQLHETRHSVGIMAAVPRRHIERTMKRDANNLLRQDDMPGLAHFCEHLLFMVRLFRLI